MVLLDCVSEDELFYGKILHQLLQLWGLSKAVNCEGINRTSAFGFEVICSMFEFLACTQDIFEEYHIPALDILPDISIIAIVEPQITVQIEILERTLEIVQLFAHIGIE